MPLFNRSVSVIVGDTFTGIQISDLKIVFNIEKTITSTQNKLRLEIYNLRSDTRTKIENTDEKIIVNAGYTEDVGEELIFQGSVSHVSHKVEPPNIITTIESGDGLKELREARSNISNQVGVTVNTVLNQLAADLKVTIKEIKTDIQEAFSNGFNFIGPTKKALDSIAENFNLQWSIQNGELQIINETATATDRVILVSPQTGLLQSPELIISDSKILTTVKTGKQKYKVSTLLLPKLQPGNTIQIQSSTLNGLFKVNTIKHTGDTHGNDWTTVSEVVTI